MSDRKDPNREVTSVRPIVWLIVVLVMVFFGAAIWHGQHQPQPTYLLTKDPRVLLFGTTNVPMQSAAVNNTPAKMPAVKEEEKKKEERIVGVQKSDGSVSFKVDLKRMRFDGLDKKNNNAVRL